MTLKLESAAEEAIGNYGFRGKTSGAFQTLIEGSVLILSPPQRSITVILH